MLMRQKAWAEGMRALVLYTATIQDQVELSAHEGEVDTLAVRLNDLLLPIVKGYGSEKSYELLATVAADLRRAPGSRRTTRSSSTSATPRSTPSTRAPPRSRAWTCSSARSCATRARPSTTSRNEIIEFAKGHRQRRARPRARAARARPLERRHRRIVWPASPSSDGLAGGPEEHLQGRPQHHPHPDGPRRPRRRLAAAAPGRGRHREAARPRPTGTSPSTRARSPRPSGSPPTSSPSCASKRGHRRDGRHSLMELDEAAF